MATLYLNKCEVLKRFFFLIVLIGLSSVKVFPQGHRIGVKINGLSKVDLYLGYYFGDKTFVLDTINLDNNGQGVFSGTNPLKQGLYMIIYPSKKYFDVIIGSDQNFEIENDASGSITNLRFSGSVENDNLLSLSQYMTRKREEYNQAGSDKLKQKQINQEVNDFQLQIINQNTGSFVAKFLKTTIDVNVPLDIPEDKKYAYYSEHYFDNYDFQCAGIIRTPTLGSRIKGFIKLIENEPSDIIIQKLDNLIEKARNAGNEELYQYLVSTYHNYFAQSSLMNHESVMVYIDKKYYLSNKANWVKSDFLEKLFDDIRKREQCLIGLYAQEIAGKDLEGNPFSLYDVKADNTIVIFWKVDNSICYPYITWLRDNLKDYNQNQRVKVVAIDMSNNKEALVDYIKKNKLQSFTNISQNDIDNQYKELYNINTAYAVYILNSNKQIIAKRLSKEDISRYIKDKENQQPVNVLALLNRENIEVRKQIVTTQAKTVQTYDGLTAVDIDIPINHNQSQYRYALIIGNENYSKFQTGLSEAIDVPFALNDAVIFKEYAEKTFGIPERNIILNTNATLGQILYALSKINKLAKYSNGKAEIVFFYAGHGVADEKTNEAYIVPVDGNVANLESSIKLDEVFAKLTEYKNNGVTAFIDATFSGGARRQSLNSVRGVKVKPKPNLIKDNLSVFYACSENQSIYTYDKVNHGLFTFELLKKLKETNGLVTLGELSNSLTSNVKSIAFNSLQKEQTPYTSSAIVNWQSIKLIDQTNQTQINPSKIVDVDNDIPLGTSKSPNTIALVIGNEDYTSFQPDLQSEANVDFAVNDARLLKEYLTKTLGVPIENIIYLQNATLGQMKSGLNTLSAKVKAKNGMAEVIFYYAGHGLPDDKKNAYIMPVDINGNNINSGIKLNDLYAQFNSMGAKHVTVFLDACFSGGARNLGLMSLRGVKVQPKSSELNGKLVVFSSSSGDESSAPYKEKQHGIFTYFLLKKIKETGGNLSYSDLTDYLTQTIPLESIKINSKEQNPQIMASPALNDEWKKWTLK